MIVTSELIEGVVDQRRIERIARERAAGIYPEHGPQLLARLRVKAQHTHDSQRRPGLFDIPSPYVSGVYEGPAVPRNDACPCFSGAKYKHCCLNRQPTTSTLEDS